VCVAQSVSMSSSGPKSSRVCGRWLEEWQDPMVGK
jgi:hypothetical protein